MFLCHRYAVVVEELVIQWIQSYPCTTESSQETEKSSRKFLDPSENRKVIDIYNSLEFGKSCEELFWNNFYKFSSPFSDRLCC